MTSDTASSTNTATSRAREATTEGREGAVASAVSDRRNGGAGNAPAIVVIGMMGSGKSRLARQLSAITDSRPVDVDALIETETGKSIQDLFSDGGESRFREIEERMVLEALDKGGIVDLGGGAIESARVRQALKRHIVVWCDVDEATAWERTRNSDRPLARSWPVFHERFARRRPLYESSARVVIWTSGPKQPLPKRANQWLSALGDKPDLRMIWARSSIERKDEFQSKFQNETSEYPCVVGSGALGFLANAQLFERDSRRCFLVADEAVLPMHQGLLPDPNELDVAIEMPAREVSKTLEGVETIVNALIRGKASRDDYVVAFGGGVIGDIAGFCAAAFERSGMPVVQAPTTLLAQVDAAYGGKTGVDMESGKHKFGAYHMPHSVLADTRVLSTLPRHEMANGLVEVIKTALLAGGSLWDRVRNLEELSPELMEDIVFDCVLTKTRIVAQDERDDGQRALLNLGHTVGHAIETATQYRSYRHGEAVGLGLLAALDLADATDLRAEVLDLLARHRLPVHLDPSIPVRTQDVLEAVSRDKKASREGPRFVLIDHAGVLDQEAGTLLESVEPDRIENAVERLRS